MITSFLSAFDFLQKGGWVAYALALLSFVLWYALGYRYLFLRSSFLKGSPDLQFERVGKLQENRLSRCLIRLKKKMSLTFSDRSLAIEAEVDLFIRSLRTHRQTIRSIVIVAPLLGLLGTVIGMIETFDSLQDAALFSQNGGIAGGISQALITTQLGLVVAIPGLLVGRQLDRKQDEIEVFIRRVQGLIEIKEKTDEVYS